jgi:uncharacterized protein
MIEMDSPVITRKEVPHTRELSLLQYIFVEWGTKEDWDALKELHYKGHTLAAGSRFMKCVLREPNEPPRLIGVMVFANPQPLSKGRNTVFPKMRPNAIDGLDNRLVNQMRLAWLNKNVTWNNRTVLDTMYRSAGIAYRFKNIAYRMYCQKYNRKFVESVSSMGRFNPFSLKTGMRFVKPAPAPAFEAGLKFFAQHFKSDPNDILSIKEELEAMPEGERQFYDKKLREFYYRWSPMEKSGDKRDLGMTRINTLTIDYVLKAIQQLVFSATVYWVWSAVDTQELPDQMPICAFDEQGPNEPLSKNYLQQEEDKK